MKNSVAVSSKITTIVAVAIAINASPVIGRRPVIEKLNNAMKKPVDNPEMINQPPIALIIFTSQRTKFGRF